MIEILEVLPTVYLVLYIALAAAYQDKPRPERKS